MLAYILYLWSIVLRLPAAIRRRFHKRARSLQPPSPRQLREKSSRERSDIVAVRKELAESKVQLEKDSVEVERMVREVACAVAEVQRRRAEVEERKASYDKALVEAREKTAEVERMKREMKRCARLQNELEEMKRAMGAERKVSDCLRAKMKEQDRLLQAWKTERGESQAYSGTINALSDIDAIRAVQALNAEILQLAAYLAEELDFQDIPPSAIACMDAENILGPTLSRMLIAVAKGHYKSSVVQLALQAAIIQFASDIVTLWASDPIQHAALQTTYEGIFEADDLKCRFVEILTHVLALAGTRLEAVPEAMIASVCERIHTIVDSALQLGRHIDEDVISGDLRVIAPNGGDTFAKNVMKDTNVEEGGNVGSGESVLGATSFGLLRQEQKGRVGETEARVVVFVLLKSSVTLSNHVGQFIETKGK